MPYCIHCGVKVSDRYKQCPLCEIDIEYPEPPKDLPPLYPEEIHKITLIKNSGNPRDMVTIQVVGFITFLLIILTSAIDIYLNRDITWSIYSTASIFFLYTILSAIVQLRLNPGLLYIRINFLIAIFLFVLDQMTPDNTWFIQYALPGFLALQVFNILLKFLLKSSKSRLKKSIIILLVINIFALIVDGMITSQITWSMILTSIILPTSLFLTYLNYILKSPDDSL